MATATDALRSALLEYIDRAIAPVAPVRAVAAIGSVALGTARPGSDIDLIAFLDPFDPYAIPAEAIWRASDASYHSIFRQIEGLQIDVLRVDLAAWREPGFAPPEGRRAELADAWLALDRGGVAELIAAWTRYDDALRQARLDEAITWLDQHLADDAPAEIWERRGPLVAQDRLQAAYTYLVQALFALNRRWQPWRNREVDALLRLPWQPARLAERLAGAAQPPSPDRAGHEARAVALRSLMADIVAQCCREGLYGEDPVGEAFVRSHEEPGRAWNLAEWQAEHRRRYPPHQA